MPVSPGSLGQPGAPGQSGSVGLSHAALATPIASATKRTAQTLRIILVRQRDTGRIGDTERVEQERLRPGDAGLHGRRQLRRVVGSIG